MQLLRYPPFGGNQFDYVRWAREVSGVTRAWCFPTWKGGGTVGVTFVMDNRSNIFPQPADVERVADYIAGHTDPIYELDGEWYHEITMNAIKRGGQRGVYLRANKERAVVHKFNQYRYIRFLNKRARKRLNTKLFRVQPYPK